MRAAERWVFYEGPPTANGPPGTHHVLSRVFKDIYPRFQTMRGRYVERKGGWDCHGLPVEIAVEQKLGISSKAEIEEKVGIERFNAECRASVFAFLEEWNRLTERIGFWLDLERAYRTLDETYIESVWWALAQIHERGLLYEGHKVVPYCPRCETTLSSHEVALGYRDVVDPSVFLKLPVQRRRRSALLVWTTTPWTLPGNVGAGGLAGGDLRPRPRRRRGARDRRGARRAGARRGRARSSSASAARSSCERYGTYEGPIFAATDREPGAAADPRRRVRHDRGRHRHRAPRAGVRRGRLPRRRGRAAGAVRPGAAGTLYNPVRPDGTYDERVLYRDGRPLRGALRQGRAAHRAS